MAMITTVGLGKRAALARLSRLVLVITLLFCLAAVWLWQIEYALIPLLYLVLHVWYAMVLYDEEA